MNSKVALKLVKKLNKSEKEYFSLFLDFGTFQQVIEPYDVAKIMLILDCNKSSLYDICKVVDEPVIVAYLDFNID